MRYVGTGIKNVTNTKPDAEFLTLEEYHKLAIKIIKIFANKKCPAFKKTILRDDDLIANVIYEIMKADWKWDKTKNVEKDKYRYICAQWGMMDLLTKLNNKKQQHSSKTMSLSGEPGKQSFDYMLSGHYPSPEEELIKQENIDLINKLCRAANLSITEHDIVIEKYIHGADIKSLAEKYNLTPNVLKSVLEKSLMKLKAVSYDYETEFFPR